MVEHPVIAITITAGVAYFVVRCAAFGFGSLWRRIHVLHCTHFARLFPSSLFWYAAISSCNSPSLSPVSLSELSELDEWWLLKQTKAAHLSHARLCKGVRQDITSQSASALAQW